MSHKLYWRQLWGDQICKPNILKLGHQNHWKNTKNRKIIVVDYTKKRTQNILQQPKSQALLTKKILEKYSTHFY